MPALGSRVVASLGEPSRFCRFNGGGSRRSASPACSRVSPNSDPRSACKRRLPAAGRNVGMSADAQLVRSNRRRFKPSCRSWRSTNAGTKETARPSPASSELHGTVVVTRVRGPKRAFPERASLYGETRKSAHGSTIASEPDRSLRPPPPLFFSRDVLRTVCGSQKSGALVFSKPISGGAWMVCGSPASCYLGRS